MKRKFDDDIFPDKIEMVEDIQENIKDKEIHDQLENVFKNVEKLLYEGCTSLIRYQNWGSCIILNPKLVSHIKSLMNY